MMFPAESQLATLDMLIKRPGRASDGLMTQRAHRSHTKKAVPVNTQQLYVQSANRKLLPTVGGGNPMSGSKTLVDDLTLGGSSRYQTMKPKTPALASSGSQQLLKGNRPLIFPED
jgi:hypothetical protein